MSPSPNRRADGRLAALAGQARRAALIALATLLPAAALGVALPAVEAGATGFSYTAGDVVVYQVGTGSTKLTHIATPVKLAEYGTSGGSQLGAVTLPKSTTGTNKPLRSSGSAASTGMLTLSSTDHYLMAVGYDTATAVTKPQTDPATTLPRTVGRVSATGAVNTTTALTDFATSNNARTAYTDNGTTLWVGGANGGVRYTTVGATTSTALKASTNVRQLGSFAGQLYATVGSSKTNVAMAQVGTGFPKTGTTTITNLTFTTPPPAGSPYAFSFLRLGTGNGPDTLYLASDTTVTKATVSVIHKYCLTGTTWKAKGTIAFPSGTEGVTGLAANVSSGTVTVYATSSGTGKGQGVLYQATDSSGFNGTASGTATKIATAPSSKYAFRGVAFAPGTSMEPTITTAASTALTVGSAGSFSVATTGTPTPSLSESGTLPSGVTFTDNGNGSGTLSGTPAAGTRGTYPVTITASNGVTPNATQAFTLTVGAAAPPTISTAYTSLAAAQGDPTNPGLAVTVGSTAYPAATLTVRATSSDTAVATTAGVTGTGSSRTLVVTPGATVGYSTVTLTVTDPDGGSASTTIVYGLSGGLGHATDRYYDGAGNGSSVQTVGTGYFLVADDLSNVLRLYKAGTSGMPVKTFDFTSTLPYRTTTMDMESSARAGTTIYWFGSESLSSKGNPRPATDTVFATHITGTGANVSLSYLGSYTGLRTDVVNWDKGNGNPLGLAASATSTAKSAAGFNIEGAEFAAGSSTTVYLGFRAPLESTSTRTKALLVPVTNLPSLITLTNTGTTPASFGSALEWNLDGRGIREIRKNATNQYLVIAGTPTGANNSFGLYSWDGNPADQPKLSPTPVSQEADGAWESIVNVPDPLATGSHVELMEDNGTTVWYGGTATSKTTLPVPLQKDLGQTFVYQSPAVVKVASTTTLTASPNPAQVGQPVTYTATVALTGGGTPSGTVQFLDGGSAISGCSAVTVSGGEAACPVIYPGPGTQTITAVYSGSSTATGSTSAAVTEVVNPGPAISITTPADQHSWIHSTASLALHAGPGSVTWSATNLPAGLSVNPSTGLISGTTATAVSSSFVTVTATSGSSHASASFTWTVANPLTGTDPGNQSTPTRSSVTLPVAFTDDIGGATLTYSATNLPAGLSIGATSGVVTGTTATTAGNSFVTVTAADNQGFVAKISFSWAVVNPLSGVTPATQNSWIHSHATLAVSFTDTVAGASLGYSATNLPTGLSISPSTGVISGTTGTTTARSYVTVSATDGTRTASVSFFWYVTNPLSATTPVTQESWYATAVDLPIAVTDAVSGASLTYSATNLPTGLSISSSTGVITGTTGMATTRRFVTVTATDGTFTTSVSFLWLVTDPLTGTTPPTQNSWVDQEVTVPVTFTTAIGVLTYSATNLPQGLAITAGSGVISGTLTAPAGSRYYVTVTAHDGSYSQTVSFLWTVADPLSATTPPAQSSRIHSAVTLPITITDAQGGSTVVYAASNLPTGLSINPSTGVITGTTGTTTTRRFVTVTGTAGTLTETVSFTWTVTNPMGSTALATQYALVGTAVTALQTGTHFTDAVPGATLSYSASNLPPGLSITAGTGAISGTPTTVTKRYVTVTATGTSTAGTFTEPVSFLWYVTP